MATESPARTPRIRPSVPVAFGVFVVYVIVFIGLSGSSGIAYDNWFDTAPNIWRTAVLPLAAASLVLIVFLLWARWDFVFRDPERLPMGGLLTALLVVYVLMIVGQFAIADWGGVGDKLLPILVAGVLVGFAEETLFRGVILRSLRTKMRPEAWVVLFSSVWFGAFHLTNIATGLNLISGAFQMFLATAGGVFLYLFRRYRGLLVVAMAAHGLWDTSAFLPKPTGGLENVSRAFLLIEVVGAIIALIVLIRRERTITVTPEGVQQL
ncbi:MAG: lysostaphin resistance A-like protein [Candidatus Nanopelagicales bacterium]